MRADHPLQIVLGLTIWTVWFLVLYGGVSVSCALGGQALRDGPLTFVNLGFGILTLVVAALLTRLASVCARAARTRSGATAQGESRRFVASIAAAAHASAALATLFVGLPLLALAPCV